MITTKINIKPHLAEYINAIYKMDGTEIVAFPKSEDLYITVSDLMQKLPSHCTPVEGNVEILLPRRSSGKSPEYYNFICKQAQSILEDKIEARFWAHLHEYVDECVHRNGDLIKDAVFMFLVRFEITSISTDALSKNYYRWRFTIKRKRKVRKYEFQQ